MVVARCLGCLAPMGHSSTIDQQINLAREWIAEKMNENPKEERPARRFGDVDSPEHPDAPARSVFDDIDD